MPGGGDPSLIVTDGVNVYWHDYAGGSAHTIKYVPVGGSTMPLTRLSGQGGHSAALRTL
jgi:hypothetical protein